jgi:hypothetical protein
VARIHLPFVQRTRRNHAIEHATVHILTAGRPGLVLAGRSDSGGFALYGDVSTAEVRSAVDEALRRLEVEPGLAVHQTCGTNLVVSAMVSALAALAALWTVPVDERANRPWVVLPRLLLASTLAAIGSQPLGPWAQRRLTTRADVGDAEVARITERRHGRLRVHRVDVRHPRGDRRPAAGDRRTCATARS